jgi:hypothetical protein
VQVPLDNTGSTGNAHTHAHADLGGHYFGKKHKRVWSLIKSLGLEDQLMDYVTCFGDNPMGICRLENRVIDSRVSDCYFGIQGLDSTSPIGERIQLLLSLVKLILTTDAINGRYPWLSFNAKYLDSITLGELAETFYAPVWVRDLTISGF